MSKLGLEKDKQSETKLPTFAGSYRKLVNSRKPSTSVSPAMLKPLTVWLIVNCGKLLRDGNTRLSYLRNLYAGQEATVRTLNGTTGWFKTEKGV